MAYYLQKSERDHRERLTLQLRFQGMDQHFVARVFRPKVLADPVRWQLLGLRSVRS